MRSWEKGNTKLIEYRMARKDGGLIWVQDRPAHAPGGWARGITAFCWILLEQKGAGGSAFRWNATKSLDQTMTLLLSGRSNRDTLDFLA